MKFDIVTEAPAPPRRSTPDQVEYDIAIRAMRESGRPIAIEVEPEGSPKDIKTRLTRAATRTGVKVTSWYDPETAKVYAQLKA